MANAKKNKSGEGAVKASKDRRDDGSSGVKPEEAVVDTFVWVAKIWILLTGASLAASSYYLLGGIGFFSKEMSKVGSVAVNPGLILAVVVAVVSILGLFRLFKGRLSWKLPSQGRWVRVTAYVSIMVLMAFGAYQLHWFPLSDSMWGVPLAKIGPFLGKTFELRPVFFPSLALVLVSGLVCHFVFGIEKWRDFMVETESELKKVSWPARPEWVGSSVVVLVVVSTMAIFLYLCDIGLSRLMNEINAGF